VKRIYKAADLPAAHLVAGLLRQAGIDARVLNENAQGGLGDIPFGEAYPEVWISHAPDATRATEIIAHFESAPTESGSVFCRACHEENPANFELCWQCGARI
jgi:hypothetical protein